MRSQQPPRYREHSTIININNSSIIGNNINAINRLGFSTSLNKHPTIANNFQYRSLSISNRINSKRLFPLSSYDRNAVDITCV